jgi:hypothetical protein
MGKSGSTTIEPAPLRAAANLPNFRYGNVCSRPNAVEQLRAGHEWDAEACRRQDQAEIARVGLQVVDAPLNGADGDRVCDQIRFEARLDDEQATDLSKHLHR